MLGEPGLNVGVLVGGVVIDDQMQLQVLGRLAVDQTQKLQPLLVAMPLLAQRDDRAVEGVERSEEGRCAVPLVVVRHGAGAPALHRQARLGAVERLDLALLVAAEHDGVLGRVEVKPHDIDQRLRSADRARA